MKRERRHELQHNDLAEWIVKTYERIVPYRTSIFGVGLLVVVLLIVGLVWHNHNLAQADEAWSSLGIPIFRPEFASEQTIDVMKRSGETYPGTPAAQWAEVFAGDTALMIGTNKILTEKQVGLNYLKQALDLYDKPREPFTIPGAQQQAMFGKARAMESLIQSKAELDESLAAYKELNQKFPHGMYKTIADQRIEELQKKDTLEFYIALAQYAPKPKVESPHSQLGNLGELPENPPKEPLTPAAPSQAVPEPPLTPVEPAKAKPETPKAGAPATGTPATGTPATGTPATGTPATGTPKTEPTNPQAAKPDVSKTPASNTSGPQAEPPKPEAAKKDK